MARLRRALKAILCRIMLVVEYCHDCGRTQPVVWHATDDLWAQVSGHPDGSGVLCPDCFDRRAQAMGMLLLWEPRIHG